MRIGAALSTDPDPAKAGAEAAGVAGSRLDGADASLALLVASRHHAPSAALVLDAVRRAAGPERVMGCVAETVVGGDREVEEGQLVEIEAWRSGLSTGMSGAHRRNRWSEPRRCTFTGRIFLFRNEPTGVGSRR